MNKSIKVNAILNLIKQVTQIIFPLVLIPYVTRTLLPDNYGRVNTGNSIISYIALIAGLGINVYAVREGSMVRYDRNALNKLSNQLFSMNILSVVVSFIVLAAIMMFIPHYRSYRQLLLIQGIAVAFTAMGADWINSIEEDYLYLTIRYIVIHIVSFLATILLVKKPEDYYVYAGIIAMQSVVAGVVNFVYIRKYVRLQFTFQIEWRRHLIPVLVLFGNSVAMTIYVNADITMLELFRGTTEVGIYSVVSKVYAVAKQLLNSILIVSIPRLTALVGGARKNEFITLEKKIYNSLITLMLPLMIGIVVFRHEILLLIGGREYIAGTDSLLILSACVFAALLATFYSQCILLPLRMEKQVLRGTILSAAINIVLNLIFIPQMGSLGAAMTTFISEAFVATYFYLFSKREGYSLLQKRTFITSFTGSLIVYMICKLLKNTIDNTIVCLAVSVLCCVAVYGVIQIVGKNQVISDFLMAKTPK